MPIIIILSIVSTLLPAFTIFFVRHKKLLNKDISWFFVFVALSAIAEIVNIIISLTYEMKTGGFIEIFSLIEFSLLVYILSFWQRKNKATQLFLICIPVYWLFYFVIKMSGLENSGGEQINYLTLPVAQLLLVGFALHTLLFLEIEKEKHLLFNYKFWILGGILIYYSSSSIVFAFTYTKDTSTLIFLGYLHAIINIIHNMFYTVGILCIRRYQQKTPKKSKISVFH